MKNERKRLILFRWSFCSLFGAWKIVIDTVIIIIIVISVLRMFPSFIYSLQHSGWRQVSTGGLQLYYVFGNVWRRWTMLRCPHRTMQWRRDQNTMRTTGCVYKSSRWECACRSDLSRFSSWRRLLLHHILSHWLQEDGKELLTGWVWVLLV